MCHPLFDGVDLHRHERGSILDPLPVISSRSSGLMPTCSSAIWVAGSMVKRGPDRASGGMAHVVVFRPGVVAQAVGAAVAVALDEIGGGRLDSGAVCVSRRSPVLLPPQTQKKS